MKTPYSFGQKILSIISTVILIGCIAGDVAALLIKFDFKSDWVFIVNMLLSVVSMAVFITLIRRPEMTGVAPKPYNESSKTVLSATRTYICIIYLDVALIMCIVVFGTAFIPSGGLSITIVGVAAIVFIISAVNYMFDCKKINSSKDSPEQETPQSEETAASAEENNT